MKYYVIAVSTYMGQCPDATHYYGKLCKGNDRVPVEEVGEWTTSTFPVIEELRYEMTLEQARKLDGKSYDRTRTYERLWQHGEKMSEKFDSFDAVVQAGINKCLELGHKGKVAVMYEGDLEEIINLKNIEND